MTFADTSAWGAIAMQVDENHDAASRWYYANRDRLFTTDYVVDETLTLLRARGAQVIAMSSSAIAPDPVARAGSAGWLRRAPARDPGPCCARGERRHGENRTQVNIMTLLRARGAQRQALIYGAKFFSGHLAVVHRLTDAEYEAAWDVFRRYDDKEWSFTDCTSKVVMEARGIRRAFTFDSHFKQFGSVIVVP